MTPDRDPHEMSLDPDIHDNLDARICAPQPDDDALIARVKARVMAAVAPPPAAAFRTVQAGAPDGWERLAPGIERKILWESQGARSCMMRFAPGAKVPAHVHGMDEECVVLEGSLRIEPDIVLQAGDFHVGRRGCAHGESVTQTGALVYLRGSIAEV